MDRIKKLELDVQKYLCLRKVLRSIELILLAALFVAFYFSNEVKLFEIIGCIVAILFAPEAFLSVYRKELRKAIKDENLIAEKELEFCSKMKTEFEKIKNDFITQGSKKFVSDECKQLVWKEEIGTGWLSIKIKEYENKCNEAQRIIRNLESIKKRLVIF